MRPKESMEKLVLFGGGKIGKRVFQRLGSDRVEAVIDSVRGGYLPMEYRLSRWTTI